MKRFSVLYVFIVLFFFSCQDTQEKKAEISYDPPKEWLDTGYVKIFERKFNNSTSFEYQINKRIHSSSSKTEVYRGDFLLIRENYYKDSVNVSVEDKSIVYKDGIPYETTIENPQKYIYGLPENNSISTYRNKKEGKYFDIYQYKTYLEGDTTFIIKEDSVLCKIYRIDMEIQFVDSNNMYTAEKVERSFYNFYGQNYGFVGSIVKDKNGELTFVKTLHDIVSIGEFKEIMEESSTE